MGTVFCIAHQRMEEETDYIDFPCSPTFLGAFHEMGQTQRRPFDNSGSSSNRGSELFEADKTLAMIETFEDLHKEVERLRLEVAQLKRQPARPVQRPNTVSTQREINV